MMPLISQRCDRGSHLGLKNSIGWNLKIYFFLDRLPLAIKLLELWREKVRVKSLLWHEVDVV
jgi:hypothetical protein